MKRTFLAVAVVTAVSAGTAFALYSVSDRGEWPKTWPKELEPLRAQSRTLVGPMAEHRHYAIRFKSRDEFEAAWPKLLGQKTKGAPIVLVRGPNFFLGGDRKAGVVVHAPPTGSTQPEEPIPVANPRERWMNTTFIELVVDGEIVDLNRVPLPPDTPIIDDRFKTTGKPVP